MQLCSGQEALIDVYSLTSGRSRVDKLPIHSGAFKADDCKRHGRGYSKNGIGARDLELFRIKNRSCSASEGIQGGKKWVSRPHYLFGNSRYPVTESPTLMWATLWIRA